ncbi:hypothetical protein B484DRAFT_26538, partial [Ochromonadaceae sp. CCMP2298]
MSSGVFGGMSSGGLGGMISGVGVRGGVSFSLGGGSSKGGGGSGGGGRDALCSSHWSVRFRSRLVALDKTQLITLDDYSLGEIQELLALSSVSPPLTLAQVGLVQDFSGGSYFWVRQLLLYLEEFGIDQFLHTIGEGGDAAGGTMDLIPDMSTKLPQQEKGSSQQFALLSTQQSSSFKSRALVKVEQLIMGRFERMAPEVQHVLRMASIIGKGSAIFRESVLEEVGAYSRHLPHFLHVLQLQRWVTRDPSDQDLLHFAHPYIQKIIYELTPSSERRRTHEAVARYTELAFPDDPEELWCLSLHYRECDSDRSLFFAARAVDHAVRQGGQQGRGAILLALDNTMAVVGSCQDAGDIDVLWRMEVLLNRASLGQGMGRSNTWNSESAVGGVGVKRSKEKEGGRE